MTTMAELPGLAAATAGGEELPGDRVAAGGRVGEGLPERFQRLQSLDDAIRYRLARVAAPCAACDRAAGGRCEDHGRDVGLIAEYRRTAERLCAAQDEAA